MRRRSASPVLSSEGWGGTASAAVYVMTASPAREAVIAGSLSRAHALGTVAQEDLPVLVEGRVTDLVHDGGRGAATIRRGAQRLRLELGSEYLLALEDGLVVAAVPDIIAVIATETGDPVPVDALRRGHDVVVATLPAPPMWREPAGLARVGPHAFGLHVDDVPADG